MIGIKERLRTKKKKSALPHNHICRKKKGIVYCYRSNKSAQTDSTKKKQSRKKKKKKLNA
jgi:hypothetical protein